MFRFLWKIQQNHHTFALFDTPKAGKLMTPVKLLCLGIYHIHPMLFHDVSVVVMHSA